MNRHKNLGRGTFLTSDLEQQPHDLILYLESMFFWMTRKELMSMAFEVAEENGIDHPFNCEEKKCRKGVVLPISKTIS